MRDKDLFYIVGVGRSGTTLLMSMLNAHPQIGTPPETHFVTNHMLGRRRVTLASCRQALQIDHRISRLGLDVSDILAPFRDSATVAWVDVYLRMLDLWKQEHGVDLVGEKAPKYVQHLRELHAIRPGAKVIHLIRDPRAVFLSRRKAAWSADHPDWRHLVAYAVQYAEGRASGPKLFGENYREILYEQLISQPELELGKLCNFLGLPYNQSMLRFSDTAGDIISDDEWDWKREAAGPLLTGNAEKWRGELSEREIALVESACRQPFTEGLYSSSDQRAETTTRMYGLLIRCVAATYRRVLRVRANRRSDS